MNRTKMDGRLLTLVALLALTGTANAWDISLELQRDALYQPGDDSSYVPGVLLLGADFPLGGLGHIRARAGYSQYLNWDVTSNTAHSDWDAASGGRLQAAPYVRIPTPLEPLSVCFGAALGARLQADASWHDYPFYFGYRVTSDRKTWAVDQSFTAGLAFDVSRRIAIDLEAERAGFALAWIAMRKYNTDPDGHTFVTSREDVYHAGWVNGAPIGLGVGLRVKL